MSDTGDAPETAPGRGRDFIRAMIEADLAAGKYDRPVTTRFPPEPNGYLHIGHAKSICLNFGLAQEYGGKCHLRFDDTNPETEDPRYVRSIQEDIRWLGFDWGDNLFHASDYFEELYRFARILVEKGKAYVCDLDEETLREYRGTVTEPGRPSPYRDRTPEENLDLLERMKAGEFDEGACTLRARIDMASPNMKMRDPLIYRIRKAPHYRRGTEWCIYPMYDFAHGLSDAIEGITHSLCTLEFENNRELYDWFVDEVGEWERPPEQTEFARLNLSYTVMSKRRLLQLVNEGHVDGWDDPRMHTLAGMRRRGYTPAAIRSFCDRIGVAKANSVVDFAQLEHAVRDDLNHAAPRVLCVLDPLEVVLTDWPDDRVETLDASYWPHDVPKEGSREVPFAGRLFIERGDFSEDPPKGWRRLEPGGVVRLRHGYVIRCDEVQRDADGQIVRLLCTHEEGSRSGGGGGTWKPRGTLHWVSADHALDCEVRVYDRLFTEEFPGARKDADFLGSLNPDSLRVLADAKVEPSVGGSAPGTAFQFERQGYFVVDPDSTGERLVFNRTVALKDSWAKLQERVAPKEAAKPAREERKAPPPTPREEAPLSPRAQGWVDDHELNPADARVLDGDEALAGVFEAGRGAGASPAALASWIVNELPKAADGRGFDDLALTAAELAELVALVEEETITGKVAKKLLAELVEEGGSARELVEARDLGQVSDRAVLREHVDAVVAGDPETVDKFRGGNQGVLGHFVGQVMKRTRGRANPRVVNELLREALG